LVFEPELSDFQSRFHVVLAKFGSELGFEEAQSEAFKLLRRTMAEHRVIAENEESPYKKLKSEPECSESRQR
jgi:hypothetical protein